MTFVAAFYNFSIELNHSDRGVYETFRLKTPRHELEPPEHLYARMIAFCHAYHADQYFGRRDAEPKEPTIWLRDIVGNVLAWTEVGIPDKRHLELSLKHFPRAEHTVYFFKDGQKHTFCHQLRGSKTNWIKDVRFYQLDPQLLSDLCEHDNSSPHWNITFIDDRIYLTVDGRELESALVPIDIWEAYQESLVEPSHEEHATGSEGVR